MIPHTFAVEYLCYDGPCAKCGRRRTDPIHDTEDVMPAFVSVKYIPDHKLAEEIRALFCKEALRGNENSGYKPLEVSGFNVLLDKITKVAFDEGREFERKQQNLEETQRFP